MLWAVVLSQDASCLTLWFIWLFRFSKGVLFRNQTFEPVSLLYVLLLTVTESYRGLNPQWGTASSPSCQLQERQQESQEAPASLICPLFTHSGQRPLGGGQQERGGAGYEGVQGGFPREGFIFQRTSWVWHWFLPNKQRGEHQHQPCKHKRSRRCFTGCRVAFYLLFYLAFTSRLPCVSHQPHPHTVLPAGGEGEWGVGWAHIDWVYLLLISLLLSTPWSLSSWKSQAHLQPPADAQLPASW